MNWLIKEICLALIFSGMILTAVMYDANRNKNVNTCGKPMDSFYMWHGGC